MISVEPSKIRLIRMSRSTCSAATARSPRAASDAAVSNPRPPRICTSSSAICHAISEAHILASAASMRMSLRSSSASIPDRSTTASSAKVVAAMNAILCATAACSPMGRPHCTRSRDHSRAIFRLHLPAPAQMAGIANRPALRVVSAILRPSPSRPIRFSRGTRTFTQRGQSVLDPAQVP